MANNDWKINQSTTTQVDRFKITIDEVMLANQETQQFSYVQFRDGVCILAITEDDHVLMLKQYRHPLQSIELEFPAGMIEEEEDSLLAAKRELLEETGYQTNHWIALDYFYPSAGSTTEKIHLFLATDSVRVAEQELEELEEIELEKVPIGQFYKLVENGYFRHGAGLACWARYLSMVRN
ncbi:NUDIX hydrolase [Gracilibacillus caseinilyticus]|uniref:NUDIX hydrolase n=1 Tax=Gracilibacillus caseinilyticus TaxID=2932256 RepID=A0ABY4EWX8_9BACI|nr:NUDIX hydrolase [Gracilibacillus caseinilyticus]UOQ46676.1 NUDIX hydrolase [Gracilibacillus caseinilyticus]